MLAAAGMIFSIAGVFGMLAGFWALNTKTQNPVWSALIMLGILCLAGFLILLIAYGTTRQKPLGAKQAMQDPVQALAGQVPSVEMVGQQIESAVRRYGAFQVAAAAAAGGMIAGLLAKRFNQRPVYDSRLYEPRPYDRYDRRNGRRPSGYA